MGYSQHKGRFAVAREDIAHYQRTCPVVALDEKLRLTQHTNINAGRSYPDGLACMQSVPLANVANAAIEIVEKMFIGRHQMRH